jgi:hypothetical protein
VKYFSPSVGDGQRYASVSPEVQVPSNHNMGDIESCISDLSKRSSITNNSEDSPMPQETPR